MEIAESIYETIWLEIDVKLRQVIVPQFWQRFHQPPTTSLLATPKNAVAMNEVNERALYQFQVGVLELYKSYQGLQTIVKRLILFRQMCKFQRPLQRCVGQPEASELDELLRVVMLSQLPANFNRVVHAFYSKSFRVFLSSQESEYLACFVVQDLQSDTLFSHAHYREGRHGSGH